MQDLTAVHRAGQTFLTWKEVDPLITAEKTTWGEIKDKLANAKDACTYRVYVHDKPIIKATFAAAQLVAEVRPLSAYNANGRNVEYLIGTAMQKADVPGEQTPGANGAIYGWHMDHPRMDRYPVARHIHGGKAVRVRQRQRCRPVAADRVDALRVDRKLLLRPVEERRDLATGDQRLLFFQQQVHDQQLRCAAPTPRRRGPAASAPGCRLCRLLVPA